LGFALHGAGGTMAITNDTGNMLRAVYPAQCTISAVLSALMAKNGVTGSRKSIEGDWGLLKIFFEGDYNRDALLGGLGKTFASEGIGYKPWPACLASHLYIDGTLSIIKEEKIKPDDVVEVTVGVSGYALNLCEPLDMRRGPGTVMDAKFSIPYIVGCAVARGEVTLRDFTPEGIKDAEALKQAKKVNIRIDNSLGSHPTSTGIVEVKTKDNQLFSRRIVHPYGHLTKPMSEKDIINKFRDCASYAVQPLPKNKIEKIIETIINLEKASTIENLVKNLQPD